MSAHFVVLRAFLDEADRAEILRLAASSEGFTPGRQRTGYDKLDISDATGAIAAIAARAKAALTPLPPILGSAATNLAWFGFDAFVLRYVEGSFIRPHVDPPLADGRCHLRLNAVAAQADEGGELRLDGVQIALEAGDAILFRPDLLTHEVSEARGRERVLLSVGSNYAVERQ